MVWRAAEIDDKSEEQQADDCDDLYRCEDELGFTINGDSEDVQTDDEGQNEGNPSSLIDCVVPEPDDDGSGRDLGAECERVTDPVVPSDSESQGRVDVTSAVLRDGTRERQPGRHLAQTLHHGVDGDTGQGVTEEDRERTRAHEGFSDSQEETCADGSAEGTEWGVSKFTTSRLRRNRNLHELDVAGLQASRNVTVLWRIVSRATQADSEDLDLLSASSTLPYMAAASLTAVTEPLRTSWSSYVGDDWPSMAYWCFSSSKVAIVCMND